MPFSAAIIGLGFIGASGSPGPPPISHAGAYREHPEVRLVAGADPDPARREAFVRTWGVERVFADYREMLAECRPEMVGVCGPTPLHHEMTRDTVAAGVRIVFLEKPVADNLEQVDDLMRLTGERGVVVAVNYGRAWDGNTREMILELRRGDLGEVRAVRGTFTGGAVHNGSHMFQLVGAVLGRPLGASASKDAYGALLGVVEYPVGKRAFFTGFEKHGYSLHELDFIADSGRFLYLSGGERIERLEARESQIFPGFKTLEAFRIVRNPGLSGCLSAAISDLLTAARDGRPPLCGLAEARDALAVGLALERSLREEGARIPLDPSEAQGD
jgi:predicted dehydrogenase